MSYRWGALGRCARAVLNQRVRAHLRREFPLVGFLGWFLLGQVWGGLPGAVSLAGLILAVCGAAAGAVGRRPRWTLRCAVWGVGAAAALAVQPGDTALRPDVSYRAQVIEAPRYPRTGEVRLVLQVAPYDGGGRAAAPERAACAAVDLPWRNINGVLRGDTFVMRARFAPVKASFSPFSYDAMLRRHGITSTCRIVSATPPFARTTGLFERWRRRIEWTIETVLGGGERAGLVTAMSIGARDVLSGRTEHAFKVTGLAHLLVVSGFQVTVVYYLASGCVGWILGRSPHVLTLVPVREAASLAGVGLSLAFLALCGLDGSSLRAGLAVVFTAAARTFERGGGMLNSMAASLLAISLVWPGVFLEPGVQLTYAALAGIALAGESFAEESGGERRVRGLIRLTVYVWVCSSLISVGWFGAFSPAALVLNPILAPIASVVGCQGSFAGFLLFAAGIDPDGGVLRLVGAVLIGLRDVVCWIAATPLVFDVLPPLGQVCIGGALGAAALAVCLGRFDRCLAARGF